MEIKLKTIKGGKHAVRDFRKGSINEIINKTTGKQKAQTSSNVYDRFKLSSTTLSGFETPFSIFKSSMRIHHSHLHKKLKYI